MKPNRQVLSVIVPAYKKESTIRRDLKTVEIVLKQIRYDYEIICVVDGRVDRTYEKARRLQSDKIKVYSYQSNRGKGYAVRFGMARAKGDLIAFIDSGMDIDPNGISMLIEHMEWYGADVILGSKRHPASIVHYPPIRRFVSFVYQQIVAALFGLKVKDTQTGLKIFKRNVLEKVLPRLLVKKFAFDVEILAVARHIGFTKIYEAPIKINTKAFVANSTVGDLKNLIYASKDMLLDTLAIYYRLYICRYYNNNNWRAWRKNNNDD